MNTQFVYTLKDIKQLKETYTQIYEEAFKIKQWPSKLKQRVGLMYLISEKFEMDVVYTEKQMNDILKRIYLDYALLRRFLIDLKLFERDDYGKAYKRTSKRIVINET